MQQHHALPRSTHTRAVVDYIDLLQIRESAAELLLECCYSAVSRSHTTTVLATKPRAVASGVLWSFFSTLCLVLKHRNHIAASKRRSRQHVHSLHSKSTFCLATDNSTVSINGTLASALDGRWLCSSKPPRSIAIALLQATEQTILLLRTFMLCGVQPCQRRPADQLLRGCPQ